MVISQAMYLSRRCSELLLSDQLSLPNMVVQGKLVQGSGL